MASCVTSLAKLLNDELKSQPKTVIVRKLVDEGTIESLTELKIKLVEESRQTVPNFPKGNLFTRRKPKGKSSFNSLEERLAGDIAELFILLDTFIITVEIKAMFKQVQPTVVASGREQVNNENESFNASFGLSQTQRDETIIGLNVHRNCRERFVELEAAFLLFKESNKADIQKLGHKVSEQAKILEIQDKQIADLLDLNSVLTNEVKKIRYALDEANSSVFELQNAYSSNVSTSHGTLNTISPTVELARNEIQATAVDELKRISKADDACVDINPTDGFESCECEEEKIVSPRPLYSEMVSDLPAPCGRMEEPREKPKNAVGEINSRIKENRVISQNFSKIKPNSASKSTEGSNIDDHMGEASDGFVGVKRKRNNTRRFFISGIDECVNVDVVSRYLGERGIKFSLLKLFKSKRKGTVSGKLHVRLVLQDNFWPQHVFCRPWLSKAKFEESNKDLKQPVSHAGEHSTLV